MAETPSRPASDESILATIANNTGDTAERTRAVEGALRAILDELEKQSRVLEHLVKLTK